jgi:hypothetical protein
LDHQSRADWLGLDAGRRWNQHRNIEHAAVPRGGKNPLAVKLASPFSRLGTHSCRHQDSIPANHRENDVVDLAVYMPWPSRSTVRY